MESEVRLYLFGLRQGNGTTDTIFSAKTSRCKEHMCSHNNLYMVFIDIQKAYDRVLHETLWWILKAKEMLGKYQQLIRMQYSHAGIEVRSVSSKIDNFDVAVNLRQWSASSNYLFLLTMDELRSEFKRRYLGLYGLSTILYFSEKRRLRYQRMWG
ncbi:putative RNA-directed DNA polymerase [Danaus plexippus plexippus]|uniref:RNA-directed DNA polymerase n=1 Tax=Danaus plexippus plexippus TaxID=278856 RepID=A0A212FGN6_DANPL|nr:putative RNA-directed DNA polymerase [Danaus plexippus plexippus]